jgi:hypothetical protein
MSPRRLDPSVRTLTLGALAALGVGMSCQAILGIDEGRPPDGAGASSALGGAGTGGGTGGGAAAAAAGGGGASQGCPAFQTPGGLIRSDAFGDSQPDHGAAVAFDGERIAVAGHFIGAQIDFGGVRLDNSFATIPDGFAAWFGLDGAWQGQLHAAGPEAQEIRGVGLDGDDVVVAGIFHSALELDGHAGLTASNTLPQSFVARVSSEPNRDWVVGLSGDASGSVVVSDMAVGDDGTAWIVGYYEGNVLVGGDLDPNSVTATSSTAFVVAIDHNGDRAYFRPFPTNGESFAWTVAMVPGAQELVIGGSFYGSVDVGDGNTNTIPGDDNAWALRMTYAGGLLWSYRSEDVGREDVYAVTADTERNVYLGGVFDGSLITFDETGLATVLGLADSGDGFIAKISPEGDVIWKGRPASGYGMVEEIEVRGLAVDSEQNIIAGGRFAGTGVEFGTASLDSTDGTGGTAGAIVNGFVTKLTPGSTDDYSHRWVWQIVADSGADVTSVAVDVCGRIAATGVFNGTQDGELWSGGQAGGPALQTGRDGDVYLLQLEP